VAAAALALLTTATYGIGWGFWAFLLARIGWGIVWSGLRQGAYQAVWSGDEAIRGRLTGLLWGIVRLGSALSVFVGGYLRDQFGYPVAVTVVACVTGLAFPTALFIGWPDVLPPKTRTRQPVLRGWWRAFRAPSARWLLGAGFLHKALEGVLISTVSLFLVDKLGPNGPLLQASVGAATVAGALLAVRWASNLAFGPAIGLLSDRLGQPRMAALLTCLLLAGVMGAAGMFGLLSVLCLALVFLVSGGLYVTLSAAASHAALHTDRPHLFIGGYTTAADGGLALGPLLAYSLTDGVGLSSLYLLSSSVLALVVLLYWWSERADDERSTR
jgi:MFS family permease